MKQLLLSLIFSLSAFAGFGQTFYVEPTEKGFEERISRKLEFEGYTLKEKDSSPDYSISFRYQQNRKNKKYEGYFVVLKNQDEVYKTSIVKKPASAFNGYNAVPSIIDQLMEKELIPEIKKGLK